MAAKYGVSRDFRTKREAVKWAKEQRKGGYGVGSVVKVPGGYTVRRTNRPIKKRR